MNRREALKLTVGGVMAAVAGETGAAVKAESREETAERWGLFEIGLEGPKVGNPFAEVGVAAEFKMGARVVRVDGFYDGHGQYKVRWMPDEEGQWTWCTKSATAGLDGVKGTLLVTSQAKGNPGPVGVTEEFHFRYADGTRYFPFGTTCYAWVFESERLQEATLANLARVGFNKVRMCVLPKTFDAGEPERHPFVMVDGKLDFTRFDVEFFWHLEQRIADLGKIGVEADVILFHPYGKPWGYDKMAKEVNERYVRYCVARLGSLRNVWWSLANEYDLLKTWEMADWDHLFRVVQTTDVAGHLRSIHHSGPMYDYAKPWVTHASLQTYDFDRVPEWKKAWGKPIVFDEVMYEGNLWRRWGNLTGEEMTRRFWLVVTAGAYCTHGEVIARKGAKDGLSADGGVLIGESPERIAFLRKLVHEMDVGLQQVDGAYYRSATGGGIAKAPEWILYYFDFHRPEDYPFPLPEGATYTAELIDPWAMTVTQVPGTFSGKSDIALVGKPYQAARFRMV
jgi:hypothetical protein